MRTITRLAIALSSGFLAISAIMFASLQLFTRDQMDTVAIVIVLAGLVIAATVFVKSRKWGVRTLTTSELESGFDVHLSLPLITFLVIIGLPSLGLLAFPFWMQTRRWPRRVDREGMTLRNGQVLRWNDINDVSRGVRTMGGTPINTWWDLHAGKQQATIMVNSLVEGREVVEFAWKRFPDPVKILAAAFL